MEVDPEMPELSLLPRYSLKRSIHSNTYNEYDYGGPDLRSNCRMPGLELIRGAVDTAKAHPSGSSKDLLLYSIVKKESRHLEAYDFENGKVYFLHAAEMKKFSCLVATCCAIYDIGGTDNMKSIFLGSKVVSTENVEVFTRSSVYPVRKISMNHKRVYASGTNCKNKIYAFGGDFFNKNAMYNYIHRSYEVLDNESTWELKDTRDHKYLKEYMSCCGIATIGNNIYLAGGFEPESFNTTSSCTVIMYGPKGCKYSKKSMNQPRSCFRLVETSGKLIAIGGNSSSLNAVKRRLHVLNTVELYNPKTNTWTNLAPMNEARQNFGVLKVSGKIYAIGGNTGEPNIEAYNLETNKWDYVNWPSRLAKNIDFGFSTTLPSSYGTFNSTA